MKTGLDHIIEIVSAYFDIAAKIGELDGTLPSDVVSEILENHVLTVAEVCATLATQMTEDERTHFMDEVNMIQNGKLLANDVELFLEGQ